MTAPQAATVILTVTNHIFSDETGADVEASMRKYADILEQQVEDQIGGRILNLEVHTQMGSVNESITIHASENMDADAERALRDSLTDIMEHILAGEYGDWTVEDSVANGGV